MKLPADVSQTILGLHRKELEVVSKNNARHIILPEDSIAGKADLRSADKVTGTGEGAEIRTQRPESY